MLAKDELVELKKQIAKLEIRVKRQRFVLLLLPIILIAAGAVAQQADEWKGESVTAKSLTIVDGDGLPRIVMAVTEEEGPTLVLLGETEGGTKTGVKLGVKDAVPFGVFVGKRGKANIGTNPNNHRPFVELLDENAKPIWGKGGHAVKD